jgi:class 3 adenylate cyclase/tetratricopeptide (TPR) repeat protein
VATPCSACGAVNDDGLRFCVECGAPQRPAVCSACGAPTGRGRFCGECGTPVGGVQPAAAAGGAGATVVASARVAERRLTSVLFGDLVGFTTLSEQRDPEQVRELLSRYFESARTVVQRYGGTVEKFIGDAVMAVWGVPVAHEDDAERCVRAGLDLADMVAALGEELGAPLALRVGIVTGEVAVTLGATGEGMVAGDAVNTAARVQAAATPGTVWVDDTTRQLTVAAVDYTDEGEHPLKGKVAPVRLYCARRVVAAVGGAQRVDGLEAPFTGRERELRLVKELFHATAEDGRPRLVLVSGTAGSGKSRLGWEFEKYIDGLQGAVRWHRGRCLAYGEGVAFWALAEMVRSRLGLAEGDSAAEVVAALERGLAELVPDEAERSWLHSRLAVLLGTESRVFPREDLFAAWTVFLQRVAAGREALVMLVEDLQYADDGILDFLEHALETAQFPLFVLALSRPELADRRAAVGSGRRATTVHLEPLADPVMALLVDGLVADLPEAARQGLVERAEGVPLYAVETVRALIDRDAVVARSGRYVLADQAGALDLLAVGAPPSLQALVSSRLDALTGPERTLVQDASVLGSTFTRQGLAALGDRPDTDALLQSLARKEILGTQTDPRLPDRGQYRFVQAVVRQVAYETLSRRDRKARHLAVAVHLGAEPDPGHDLAAVVAQHYLDAAANSSPDDGDEELLTDRAQELLRKAAERALALGSSAEALRHYRAALELPGSATARPGLLEGAAAAALSVGHADLAHDLAREAVEAHRAAGHELEAARAVAVQGDALVRRQELTAALDLLRPVYAAMEQREGAEPVLLALTEVLGRASNYLGDRMAARGYTERMLLLAEAAGDYPRLVSAMTSFAISWLSEGSPTTGLALLNQAVELARRQQLPSALMRPLLNVSAFHGARDLRVAIDTGQESLRLAEQAGDRLIVEFAALNFALALWTAGRWEELRDLLDHTLSGEGSPGLEATAYVLSQWMAAATGQPRVAAPPSVHVSATGEELSVRFWSLLALSLDAAGADARQAAALSREAVGLAVEAAGLDDDFVHVWTAAVQDAVAAGDEPAAAELLELVTTSPPGLVTPYVAAQLPRLQALVAELRGDGGVEDLLRTAVERLAAFGARLPQGQAELALGRHLLQAGRDDEARAALDRAATIFAGVGATALQEQVAAMRSGGAVLSPA